MLLLLLLLLLLSSSTPPPAYGVFLKSNVSMFHCGPAGLGANEVIILE